MADDKNSTEQNVPQALSDAAAEKTPETGGGPASVSEPMDEKKIQAALGAEMMDREERKALKKKAREEARAAEALRSKPVKAAKKPLTDSQKSQRKKYFKYGSWAAGGVFLIWVYNFLFAPFTAGLTYGICKNFLELNVRYPQELRLSEVNDFGDSVRIWYTQVDPFGEYRMENIQCFFRADPVTGAAVDKITINRREVDRSQVEAFNKILPVIINTPQDLTIPYPPPDSLSAMQFETNLFRKPLFLQKQ